MAFNTPPTVAELAQAGTDIENLALVVQGPSDHDGDGTVTMRNGSKVKTLALIIETADSTTADLETRLVEVTAKEALLTLIGQELAPDGSITRVSDELTSVIVASGVDPVTLDHDTETGTIVDDPRTVVTRQEIRDAVNVTVWYRPRVLPYTIEAVFDPADYFEIPSGTAYGSLETQLGSFLKRLARLETFHPAIAPVIAPMPSVGIEDGESGVVIDFADYVTDTDSPPENLNYALTGLPAGFTLTGTELFADAPGLTPQTDVTLTVTDESGNETSRIFKLEVYAIGATPVFPPTFGNLPNINQLHSSQIQPRDLRNDVSDPDHPDTDLTFSILGDPTHGVTVTPDGLLGGFAGPPNTYTVTIQVADPDGQTATSSFTLTTTAAAAPEWQAIPGRTVSKGAPAIVVDLAQFVGDPVTPDVELALTAQFTGLPSGATTNGLKVTLPTGTQGAFRIGCTVTNRAGHQATTAFDYVVTLFQGGFPGFGDGYSIF